MREVLKMRSRKLETGNKNIVGQRIVQLRNKKGIRQKDLLVQLQIRGVDVSYSVLSKIEGQTRAVYDYELLAFADIFGVTVDALLGRTD